MIFNSRHIFLRNKFIKILFFVFLFLLFTREHSIDESIPVNYFF